MTKRRKQGEFLEVRMNTSEMQNPKFTKLALLPDNLTVVEKSELERLKQLDGNAKHWIKRLKSLSSLTDHGKELLETLESLYESLCE